jgi:hypothetical protein
MDVTRDTDGQEVLIYAGDGARACTGSVVKIRLADGYQTCLFSFDSSLAVHVSAPDAGGWVFISTYAPSDPVPLKGWKPYTNEILQVKLDGSEVRRLAQHRSRPFNSYTWTPRAAVSRDGSRVIYSSNYGLPSILGYSSEYSDVYHIDVSSTIPTSAGSENSPPGRFEQGTSAVSYSGTWLSNTYSGHSGGSAVLSMAPGARATFSFTGTAVSWIGYHDILSGIANVYVDNQLKATVDTYAAPGESGAVLFRLSGLPLGSHSLAIEVTGARDLSSGGAWVWIDGFDALVRFEQEMSAVTYSGAWVTLPHLLLSGGSAVLSMDLGARTTFSFTGTAVSWIGHRDEWSGIARVYLDGTMRAEIDTYATPARAQSLIYTLSGLQPGPHTLTIEATGQRNPASAGVWIWVDAFETPP